MVVNLILWKWVTEIFKSVPWQTRSGANYHIHSLSNPQGNQQWTNLPAEKNVWLSGIWIFWLFYSIDIQLKFSSKELIKYFFEKGHAQTENWCPPLPKWSCSLPLSYVSTARMSFIHPNIHTWTAAPPPPPVFRDSGATVYDAVCAVFSSWRAARGHGTTDLLTERCDNHDLREKRMPMLRLIMTVERVQTVPSHSF